MSIVQRILNLTDLNTIPALENPPRKLFPFMGYYLRQFKYVIAFLYVSSILSSALDAVGPYILRHVIDLILTAPSPQAAWPKLQPLLIAYVGTVLILSNLVYIAMSFMRGPFMNSTMRQVIRLQLHRYLLKQSWTFFQNDFAGRLTSKVMDIGGELRNIIMSSRRILVAFAAFVVAGTSLFLSNPWLVVPFLVWFALSLTAWYYMIPRLRRASTAHSNVQSLLTGRMVDTYTNIQTVKLFTNQGNEDTSITRISQQAREKNAVYQRLSIIFDNITLTLEFFLNASLLLGSIWLWYHGLTSAGTIAMVVPLSLLIIRQASMMREELNGFLESVGIIEDGINTLVHPLTVQDVEGAPTLSVTSGKIKFANVTFAYNKGADPILTNLNLTIPAGQKVGLIGHSGAGKSTLVNLLLRFYEVSEGAVTIDGHDISEVTQNSLRAAIGMVTQDTSLLHRSIRANIAYGKPEATDADVIAAAKLAHAHDFILNLTDKDGNKGYESRVGERGVKLSGGQRQRIAIARLILKNAPILIMDEATAALDSEVEYAIQENLTTLMEGKTVIAIAHRLSTISQLDRLLVLEHGQIVEDGTHAELLKKGGTYAQLWSRQSGGFLPE